MTRKDNMLQGFNDERFQCEKIYLGMLFHLYKATSVSELDTVTMTTAREPFGKPSVLCGLPVCKTAQWHGMLAKAPTCVKAFPSC